MWCDVMWGGVMWCGMGWCDVVWCGVMWCGEMRCDVVWCDVMWGVMVWCDVVWCGVVWCDVMWCEVMWGVMWSEVMCCVVLCCDVMCCVVLIDMVLCWIRAILFWNTFSYHRVCVVMCRIASHRIRFYDSVLYHNKSHCVTLYHTILQCWFLRCDHFFYCLLFGHHETISHGSACCTVLIVSLHLCSLHIFDPFCRI